VGTHPGEGDDPERHRYRWGYRWGDELAFLTSPAARRIVDELGFSLGGYRDLDARAGGAPSPR
jgi:chitin disaccharide deacetylase